MYFKAHGNSTLPERQLLTKTLRAMKVTAFLILAGCLQVSAHSYGQDITLSVKNAPLEKVFEEVKRQTGYSFIYTRELLKNASGVTLDEKNASLEQVLQNCFKDQPLSYSIEEKFIIVRPRISSTPVLKSVDTLIPKQVRTVRVQGQVFNEAGESLSGANIVIKELEKGTITDAKGQFEISAAQW